MSQMKWHEMKGVGHGIAIWRASWPFYTDLHSDRAGQGFRLEERVGKHALSQCALIARRRRIRHLLARAVCVACIRETGKCLVTARPLVVGTKRVCRVAMLI